jgi:hypothetical protein
MGKQFFPPIAIGQEFFFIVYKLAAGIGGALKIRPFHKGIHGASLLAKAAVNALGHINLKACGAAAAIFPLDGFNGDGPCRANSLAELAGNAAFLPTGVAAQGMLTPKAWTNFSLLVGVHQRYFGFKKVTERCS